MACTQDDHPHGVRCALDAPLPREVATGAGTAIFVAGWCFVPGSIVTRLALSLGGEPQEVLAHSMPRLDLFHELGEPAAYRSGFWGLVRIGPGSAQPRELALTLHAELRDRGTVTADLTRIRVCRDLAPVEREPADPARPLVGATPAPAGGENRTGDEPLIAICMATYNPPPNLLARQLDSIRAQTHTNWVCAISDDRSRPDAYGRLRAEIGEDPRFVISRSEQRLGFYRNFERALTMAPSEAAFVAPADQDDAWYPDKLATLLEAIGDAPLVYSDARIVRSDGTVESDTYWRTRRNNHADLLSLLVANSVTGAASLMRRELLDDALPFPPRQFSHYHDHWLALVALALDRIEFVPRPLYDYIQHGGASLGHATANQMPTLGDRVVGLWRRSPRERIRKWRMHYFVDIARLMQFGAVLQLRCGTRMTSSKRRELDRFLRADESLGELVSLTGRGLRELVGTPETLGAEWMLSGALVWRRLVSATARDLPQRRGRLDAVPPPDLAPGPARAGHVAAGPASMGTGVPPAVRMIEEKVAPLPLTVSAHVTEPRINLLIPTVDLAHLFAGYIAKFNLALALARRGHRVRIVTVDATGPLPRDWEARVESYSGLAGLRREVEFAFGRESAVGLDVGSGDSVIATTWWTAHVARSALRELGRERFLYLIQEYEPFTFPMSTHAALAAESYTFPHEALFSTELLRGYFQKHGLGVYADGRAAGDAASFVFDNAITDVPVPSASELGARPGPKRLLFYARPEPHAARNLFELGVLALRRAAAEGCFAGRWELSGIGSVAGLVGNGTDHAGGARVQLGDGLTLQIHARSDQRSYAELLRRHDVGLALMYTPHPSLVPLEMASAGMVTVTNSFENKTADRLRALSANFVVAEPTVESVAAALGEAVARTDDPAARAAGAAEMRWPRSWPEAFDERVLAFVEGALERARVS